MSIKIYYNPECQKCRDALNAVCEAGNKPEIIEYLNDTPTFSELKKIIKKLKLKPFELIRQKEEVFQTHFLNHDLSDDEWIKAMVKYPILIQRPIIINDDKAVIGRSEEIVKEILKINSKNRNKKNE
jgi:arsenate reductase (glutaredoxin)